MSEVGKVLLITGPAGSGKSTLGHSVADRLGWRLISEDDYWTKNGWRGHRTEEQEESVQAQVGKDLLDLCRSGQNAVLEFILYKDPPNPLTAYQELLGGNAISFTTVALKPSVGEILRRIEKRGRPHDLADPLAVRQHTQNQVGRIASEHVNPEWVIDSTDVPVQALTDKVVSLLGIQGK